MTIQTGDRLPEANLYETTEWGDACPLDPQPISTTAATKGKRIVIFGLPGAYTPTCSARHVPGYLESYEQFKGLKVDEIWCVSVNDGYVMAEWGKAQKALGKIRFLGDGSADFTKKLGLERQLVDMGTRMKRFSMFVDDGVVKQVNVENPGKFEVSDAATMVKQLR
jgi:peroxiredoxin